MTDDNIPGRRREESDPGFIRADPRDDAEELTDDELIRWLSSLTTCEDFGWLSVEGEAALWACRDEMARRLTTEKDDE